MSLPQAVADFVNDDLFKTVLILIALDVIFGVIAALKTKQFKFTWLAAFARDDLLAKVLPWFAIYAASKFAPKVEILGIDLDAYQKVVFGFLVAALVASLVSSAKDLGLPIPALRSLPNALSGERQPPPEP